MPKNRNVYFHEKSSKLEYSWFAIYPRTEKITKPESIEAVKLMFTKTNDHFHRFCQNNHVKNGQLKKSSKIIEIPH